MRPVKLTISAFGPYSQVEVIDFRELQERNLFLVTGPTGSGKTTIFDAISYALYGKASGDQRTEDTLRSHFSDESTLTEIKLTFELKGTTYHVHRIPKQMRPKAKSEGLTEQKSDATLTIEGDDPGRVITGVSKVNKKLEEVLGINEEQFKQIMMIPQGEFRKLLTSDSQEREKVLQQLFDTYIYRRIQSDLNEQAKNLGSEIKSKKVERDTLVTKIKSGDHRLLQEMLDADDKFIDGIVEKTNELLKQDTQLLKKIDQELVDLDKDIQAIHKNQVKVEEDNKNLEMQEVLSAELKSQELLIPRKRLEAEQIALGEKAARLLGIEENILTREKVIESKKQEQIRQETKMKRLASEIADVKKTLDAVRSPEAEEALHQKRIYLSNYKSYVEKVIKIESIMKEIQSIETAHESVKRVIEDNFKNLEELNKNHAKHQNELESLKDLSIQQVKAINQYDLEINKRRQVEKVKEQIDKLRFLEITKKEKLVKLEQSQKVFEQKTTDHKEGQYIFLINQAAFLAAELKKGEACPVCGSIEHPLLAKMPEAVVTEEALERLEALMNEAKINYNKAKDAYAREEERYISGVKTSEEHITELYKEHAKELLTIGHSEQKSLIEKSLSTITEKLTLLEEEIKQFVIKEKHFKALEKMILKLNEDKARIETKQKELESTRLEQMTLLTKHKTTLGHIYDEVPKEMRQLKVLEERITLTDIEIKRCEAHIKETSAIYDKVNKEHIETSTQMNDLEKAIRDEKKTLKELNETLSLQMAKAGFINKEAFTKAKLDDKSLQELKEVQTAFHQKLEQLKVRLKELNDKTKNVKWLDLQQFEIKLEEKKNIRKEITEKEGTIQSRILDNESTLKTVVMINNQIKDKEAKYNVLGKLARIAQGNNPAMMTFERYVLAAFLEDILKAANIRLRQMTQGRYVLSRTDELQRKNKQSGLELEVFDNFTGRSRHVKTLSGGEGFKASLSMALGLSDVVQSYAGGVRLDTMFIDEGFGTLDQESLDSAINCLIDLQKSGRLVGIISHVQELKERIDTRLEIMGTNKGSESRFVLG